MPYTILRQATWLATCQVGTDLVTNLRISLLEALLGFEREIKHLDGHLVQVSVPRGVVVQPDEVLVIEGEGMPLDLIQWRELACYRCST